MMIVSLASIAPPATADPAAPPSLLDQIPVLEPDISPASFMESTPWLLYMGAALLLLAILGVLLYIYLQRRKPVAAVTESAEQRALKKLALLEPALASSNLATMSIELSLVLREFITGETDDPALFETHQEFNQRLDALTLIPHACQEETHRFLDRLAQLKYAGAQQARGDDAALLLEQTRELIIKISLHQRQAIEQAASATD